MSANSRMKDKTMAAHLKSLGIRRTTGQCPSCHKFAYSISKGGMTLISHLGRCKGRPRKVRR